MRWQLSFFFILGCLLICSSGSLFNLRSSQTALPTLTPTPPLTQWQVHQVIRGIRQAGLECVRIQTITDEANSFLPAPAAEGVRFFTPSICPGCGGIVLGFDEAQALEAAKIHYLQASTQNSPGTSSWVFAKDNILLQLSGEIPKPQAVKYGAALVKLR